MLEKYRPNFDSLAPEEAAHVARLTVKQRRLEDRYSVPAEDESVTGENVYNMCAEAGLDQADVVMVLARDASALGVSALEKLVGRPIQRTRTPSSRSRSPRGPRPVLRDDRVIRLLVDENPKKRGSKSRERFELYRDGMTVQQFREAGGTGEDVKWDAERGFIRVEDSQ